MQTTLNAIETAIRDNLRGKALPQEFELYRGDFTKAGAYLRWTFFGAVHREDSIKDWTKIIADRIRQNGGTVEED